MLNPRAFVTAVRRDVYRVGAVTEKVEFRDFCLILGVFFRLLTKNEQHLTRLVLINGRTDLGQVLMKIAEIPLNGQTERRHTHFSLRIKTEVMLIFLCQLQELENAVLCNSSFKQELLFMEDFHAI